VFITETYGGEVGKPPPSRTAAAIVLPLTTSTVSTSSFTTSISISDEITGNKHSAMSVYEQRALMALQPTGPWVWKPEVLTQITARAQSSNYLHVVPDAAARDPAKVG
jgi:hypothetical protein